ncbi:MAG: hypothetical protein RLZZ142_303 [Verrucomicrobiota bacterium]
MIPSSVPHPIAVLSLALCSLRLISTESVAESSALVPARRALPVSVGAIQSEGVEVFYDLEGGESTGFAGVSLDGGASIRLLPPDSLSGDVGAGVKAGKRKRLLSSGEGGGTPAVSDGGECLERRGVAQQK